MKKNIELCLNEECSKQAISFSDYCAEHTEVENITKNLKNLEDEDCHDVYLAGIVIESIHFANLTFDMLSIIDCELEAVIFENCVFRFSQFSSTTIRESSFKNCTFIDTDWSNVLFQYEVIFDIASMKHNQFIACHFTDNVILDNLHLEFSQFMSCTFFEIDHFKNCILDFTDFTSCSFNEVTTISLTFKGATFQNTVINDCIFEKAILESCEHDFAYGSLPKLCDFSGSQFIDTDLPELFFIWNNYKEDSVSFYNRIINIIKEELHHNHLWALNVCVTRLNEIGIKNDKLFIEKIVDIYSHKWQLFVEQQEYGVLGKIIEEFDALPKVFKQTQPLLSASNNDTNKELEEKAQLKIIAKCDNWTIAQIHLFQTYLLEIELLLPNKMPFRIVSIKKGSITQIIIGELDAIMYFAGGMAFVTTFIIFSTKSIVNLKKEKLALIQKEEQLKRDKQLHMLNLKQQELDIKQRQLEIYELKNEILRKHQAELHKCALELGIDIKQYLKSEQGKKMKNKIVELHQHFPIESFELKY